MIKTSLIALALVVVTAIGSQCGGPTGDTNPRPPAPTAQCTTDTAGNLECELQSGRG